MNMLTIPKALVKNDELVVLEKKDFEKLYKENRELRMAVKAVLAGELAFLKGKTRPLRAFLRSRFPEYAKNY